MPIKFASKDLEWGVDMYLKKDPEQLAYTLIGVNLAPGNVIFVLSSGFDCFEVYDFEASIDRDEALRLSYTSGEE